MARISDKAVVERGARLADDVVVGAFAYVGADVRVDRGCVIDSNATVLGRTTVGARTHIFPLAVVGAAPPGADDEGECTLGEANAIRELVTVYAGTDAPTRLGIDNLMMIGSTVGAGATLGDHGIFANCTQIREGAVIEDYVRSSAFPVVAPHVRVGAYTFINGYARVDRDVPPFAIVEGVPVRVRGVNAENLRRCGFDDRDVRALKNAFRELYGGAASDPERRVVDRLQEQRDLNPHVRRLLDALAAGRSSGDAHV